MPPEPLPWERKELFIKERKESVARWRDRDNSRWPSPADFRRPSGGGGHGKQGGWHVFNEEPSHGYGLSRSNSKIMEDENVRMSSHMDGRYGRNGRDNRGGGSYYCHREWKVGHPWEMNNGSPSPNFSMGRPNNVFPSVSAGRASHGGFSSGRMNFGSPNMSAGMLSNGSPGVLHGRPSNISPSVSAGRPSNVSPSISAGRPSNVSPSISAGRPSNVSPSVSAGRPSNVSPSVSAGRPSNVSPSVSAGRPSNVSPSVSAGRPSNVSPSVSAGRPSNVSPNVSVGKSSNFSPSVSVGKPSNVSPSVSVGKRSDISPSVTGKPCNVLPSIMFGRPSNGLPCLSSVMSVDVNIDQRLVNDVLTPSSHPPCSEFGKGLDQVHSENQLDKISAVSGLGAGQKCEKENLLGLDRKLRTWTRSGSLSSRGSGFSHSSSSKSMAVDSIEGSAELQQKIVSPLLSPVEFTTCQASSNLSEDMSSRKKPRLGWGEGLAKYEKKKTDGPDDLLLDKSGIASPRAAGFSDCGSPATPSSIACSSSPVVEDRSYVKAENTDNDVGNRSMSPNSGCEDFDGFSINLEKLDLSAVTNMVSSLVGCIYSDDQSMVDNFGRSTAMNKLLLLKADILKTVELTESEVDSLENELKSLKRDRNSLGSLYSEGDGEQIAVVNVIPRPAPLLLESSTTIAADRIPFGCTNSEDGEGELKNEDVDSPGTATSRLAELCPLDMVPLVSETGDDGFSAKFDGSRISKEAESRACHFNGEQTHGSTPRGNDRIVCGLSDASLLVKEENRSRDSILVSNWEAANQASEIFNKLLPAGNKISAVGDEDVTNFQNLSSIREKFVRRKQFLRFKERAVTLKFRALKHIWKEDIRLLSNGRSRTKPHKRLELQSRISLGTLPKNRSSIRTRFSSPAGQLNLVPTSETINYTGKLLSDSQMKPCRTMLKMPALILDDKEKAVSRFVSTNGLVEDPCAVEKERTLINPWTSEEKETFIDKLALFGKDFQKISSFLDHKTTADCVEFYYKNHKSDCFERTKRADFKKQGKLFSANTYLVTSGKKWNWDVNAASLDMLGAASAMAACVDDTARKRQANSGRFLAHKARQGGGASAGRLKNTAGNERESVAADVLAGICGSLSSEAMSSCITSSVDNGESYLERKCKAVGISHKQPLTIEVTQNADDETCSDESCGEMDPADWTDMEKSLFIQAVTSYGKDFLMISRCVKTRSRDQCKVFFSKARKCLGLDLIHAGNNVKMAPSDDATGGGSDTDNACTMETRSVNCDTESRQDKMVSLSVSKFNHDESFLNDLKPEQSRLEGGTVEMDHSVEADDDMVTVGAIENSIAGNFCAADDDSNAMNGSDCKHESGYAVVSSGACTERSLAKFAEELKSVHCKAFDPCSQQPSTMIDIKAEVLIEEFAAEKPGEPVLSQYEKQNNNYQVANAPCGSVRSTQNSSSCQDATQAVVCSNSCAGFSVISESENVKSNDTFHAKKPPILLRSSPLIGNQVAEDAILSQDEKPTRKEVNPSGTDSKHHQEHSLVNHVESFPPLTGYPLQTVKKEMNNDVCCTKPSAQSLSNSIGSLQPKQCMAQDSYLRKCSEHPFLVQSLEQKSHHHPRSHSQSSSDSERASGHGDVKLFGQILSHPSSQQKPNSSALEIGLDNVSLSYLRSENKPNLNFSGHQSIECSSDPPKADRNNHHSGLENLPMSYGFWDGSRIQTGLMSLPDSAVLLAKYPAAFSSYGTSSSKAEQKPSQSVVKVSGTDQNNPLSCVSVFPSREVIHGGRGQPFTMDLQQKKLHQDIFSELQRRNGYEAVSPSLQQGRGMTGMNVVGVGGVLVGGPCPAISDPVAAIKMHYAKAEQFGGGQGGSIVREDESWRSNVDIGSR